jgi:hypothetical protein
MLFSGTPWLWVIYPIALVPMPVFSLYFIVSTFPLYKATTTSVKRSSKHAFSSASGPQIAGQHNSTQKRAKSNKELAPNLAMTVLNNE